MKLLRVIVVTELILLAFLCSAGAEDHVVSRKPTLLLQGKGPWESAPHGMGNVYAPDVLFENGVFRMWYGGQGKDGHDRILYAESRDGEKWNRKGLALEDAKANHVNDPSVVKTGETYYLYYTRAEKGIIDNVCVATSKDGLQWKPRGAVIVSGKDDQWDSLLVGRPTVLYEDGLFKMWFDGRKDLPLGAASPKVPKTRHSRRSVGYATSKDGLVWTKHPLNPVFENNAGGIDVKRIGSTYVMLYESHSGTKIAVSSDGVTWNNRGLKITNSDSTIDRFGHVTPFLFLVPGKDDAVLYFGAASHSAWDRNGIASVHLTANELKQFCRTPGK